MQDIYERVEFFEVRGGTKSQKHVSNMVIKENTSIGHTHAYGVALESSERRESCVLWAIAQIHACAVVPK